MTDKTDANPDWDDELQELVDGVLADSANDAPTDVVDAGGEPQDKDTVQLLAERTLDLQRLQAEYVNYKRRVDRDRDLARQRGIEAVLVDLLPVLDGIEAARAHQELTGGAAMLADEVAKVATKYGLTSYGAPGDPFNPHVHEALMRLEQPGFAVPSVAQVFQPGYAIGERIVRPARVGVADADESLAAEQSSTEGQSAAAPDDTSPDATAQDSAAAESAQGQPGSDATASGEPTQGPS